MESFSSKMFLNLPNKGEWNFEMETQVFNSIYATFNPLSRIFNALIITRGLYYDASCFQRCTIEV